MFRDRYHNGYQRTFQFTLEELKSLMNESHDSFKQCSKLSESLQADIDHSSSSSHVMLLKQDLGKMKAKYSIFTEIMDILNKNLEYAQNTKIKCDEQSQKQDGMSQFEELKSGGPLQEDKVARGNQQLIDKAEEDGRSEKSRKLEAGKFESLFEDEYEEEKELLLKGQANAINSDISKGNQQQIRKEHLFEEVKEEQDQQLDYESLGTQPFSMNLQLEYNDSLLKGEALININASGTVFKVLLRIFQSIEQVLVNLIAKKGTAINEDDYKLYVNTFSQFDIYEHILYSAFKAPKDSLFYKSNEHKDWRILDDITTVNDIKDQKAYEKDLSKNFETVKAGGSIFSFLQKSESSGASKIFKVLKYVGRLSPETKNIHHNYFIATYRKEQLFQFYNMQSTTKFLNTMLKMSLPSIYLKQIIYVPMIAPLFTMEEELTYEKSQRSFNALTSNVEDGISHQNPSFIIGSKQYNPKCMVKIRVLSSTNLDVDFKTGKVNKPLPKLKKVKSCFCFKISKQLPIPVTKIEKLIIHFHGGGFICMDSCLNQNHTRQWVNDLDVPVMSVDYRLAPKNPFPDPVNDCFQAYYWILNQAKSQLGIDPKNVIVTGDSAGGHLSVAITILSILRGVQVPSGLLLHYPLLSTDMHRFCPSSLLTFDDIFLNQNFTSLYLNSFSRNGGDPSTNPLMSPILASDNILKQFPPTRIIACEIDPLRDQSFEFALRLKKLGVDVKLDLMKDYIHGYNVLDTGFGVKEFHHGTLLQEQLLKELFSINDSN